MLNTVVLANSIYIAFLSLEKFEEIIVKHNANIFIIQNILKAFMRLNSKIH
jgi:hypothetical protein